MSDGDGWMIHRFPTVSSTQHVAAELIARGAPHRTVVVADRQTEGYGRKGDRWLDNPGDSLLMTLILRPTLGGVGEEKGGSRLSPSVDTPTALTHYPMAAALAVLDAIAGTVDARGAIKWPNDILLGGKKVGGILGDAIWSGRRLDALRIGIGVNIRGAQESFIARGLPDATSIAAATDRDLDREVFLHALLHSCASYDSQLAAGDTGEIVFHWRAAIATVGQCVTVTLMDGRTVRGIATDVADDGDLLVTDASGTQMRISAPMVRSLRPVLEA